jgi:phosphoglycolate phosphatase-like HAD superfamily hydrolase
MMEKKNLIVFDIDGTLTDTVQLHQSAFIQSLKQLNVKEIDTNFKEYKHHTDSYIAKIIYEKYTNKLFDEKRIMEFENFLLQNISKQDILSEIVGAKKIIDFLEKETNYGVCYATGSLFKPAEYKLNKIGIDFNQKQLVASNHILDREGIVNSAIVNAKEYYKRERFETIISIGDGIWDLKTARNLSLDFIGIGKANKENLIQNGAEIYLNDLSEFDLKKIEKKLLKTEVNQIFVKNCTIYTNLIIEN